MNFYNASEGGWRQEDPWSSLVISLGKPMSSSFSERPYPKTKMEINSERYHVALWPPC